MTTNPLADAVSRLMRIGPPPVFKVVASAFCERDKMLVIQPRDMGVDFVETLGVTAADLEKHPGLMIIVVPTEQSAEQIRGWARELDLELIED